MTHHHESPDPAPAVDLSEALSASLRGDHTMTAHLPAADRALIEQLVPYLEALRESEHHPRDVDALGEAAPPLENDPVAIALGLVARADELVSGPGLRAARQQAGLTVADVAARLAERGWTVRTKDVFRWEQSAGRPIAPALLTAIADVVRSPSSALVTTSRRSPSPLLDLLDDAEISAAIARWAADEHKSASEVRRRIGDTLHAAAFRNQSAPSRDALLAVIAALRAIDAIGRRDR